MTSVTVTAMAPKWELDEMAENMAELVLSRIGDDSKATRWSAGLALVCFAPRMPKHLDKEVYLRLSSVLPADRRAAWRL